MANKYKNIPQELRLLKQWGLYKLENADKGHGASKKPINANTGAYASSTNADTWTDFDTALNNLGQYNTNGLAFFFANGYVGLDLDELTQPKQKVAQKNKTVQTVMDKAKKPYIERSQSGTGIHAIFKGSLQKDWKHKSNGHEIYDSGRFFALTGDALNSPDELPKLNDLEMPKLYDTFFDKPVSTRGQVVAGPSGNDKDLAEIFQIAKNDDKFNGLIKGDIRDYNSQSEADQALANKAIWYANHDMDKAREIMENSALVRDKWYEKHGRDTYLNLTLQRADKDTVGGLTPKENKYSIQFNHIDKAVNSDCGTSQSINEKIVNPNISIEKAKSFTWDDQGMRDLFLQFYEGKYRYDAANKITYMWNGKKWVEDSEIQIKKDFEKVTKKLSHYEPPFPKTWEDFLKPAEKVAIKNGQDITKKDGLDVTDVAKGRYADAKKKYIEKFQAKVAKYRNHATKQNAIKEIDDKQATKSDKFDADLSLLNIQNGTLDLVEHKLKFHNSKQLLTKISNVDLILKDDCPLWQKTLNTIFDGNQSLIDFLQIALGYSLLGGNPEAVMFQLWGATGRNGKSVITETIANILADYATTIRPDWLTTKKFGTDDNTATNTLVKMKNRRLVFTSELPKGAKADEQKIKSVTGDAYMSGRGLYEKEAQIPVTWTIWLNTNYKLQVRGQENAIWERIITIPFNHYFKPEERDTELKEKLEKEKSGIFNWMLEGLKIYQEKGLQFPQDVIAIRNDDRQKADVCQEFFDDNLKFANVVTQSVTVKRLKDDFLNARHDSSDYSHSGEDIEEFLINKGAVKHKTNKGYVFVGVCYNGLNGVDEFSEAQWKIWSQNIAEIDAEKKKKQA